MSSTPPTPPTSPAIHYPEWQALVTIPADQEAAIEAFLAMARVDSEGANNSPRMRVIDPFGGKGMVWLEFDLRDPNPDGNEEGNQDHTLFKGDDDKDKRKNKGKRLPADYLLDRAARIKFISAVLKHKGVRIYRCIKRPKRLVYNYRTGPNEHFLVVVHHLPTDNPRMAYVTAYYISDAAFQRSLAEVWTRLYPKASKPMMGRNK
jgi:hypothetical protein